MTRRIWTGLAVIFIGVLESFAGPTAVLEYSPSIKYPGCKGYIATLELCDRSAHSVVGWHMVALVCFIIGGIAIAVTGTIIACTKAKR